MFETPASDEVLGQLGIGLHIDGVWDQLNGVLVKLSQNHVNATNL